MSRLLQVVLSFLLLLCATFTVGCTSNQPVPVSDSFWETPHEKTIGIVLAPSPDSAQVYNLDTFVYTPTGQATTASQGALEGAIAGAIHATIAYASGAQVRQHVKAVEPIENEAIQPYFKAELESAGFRTVQYDGNLHDGKLSESLEKAKPTDEDLAFLFGEIDCDTLIILTLKEYGILTKSLDGSPPQGVAVIQGKMVDKEGGVLWDSGAKEGCLTKRLPKNWHDDPNAPFVEQVINYAVERSNLFLLEDFFSDRMTETTENAIIARLQDYAPWQSPGEIELDIKYLTNPGKSSGFKNPYDLTQDYSNWKGATRKIEVNGKRAKVGATSDGKVIVVYPYKLFTFSSEQYVEEAIRAALDAFVDHQEILDEVIEIKVGKVTGAYYIKLNQEGYSLLKDFTIGE